MSYYLLVVLAAFVLSCHGFPHTEFYYEEFKLSRQRAGQLEAKMEDDMLFPISGLRGAPSRSSNQCWLNGIIPYLMTSSISGQHQLLIVDAMQKIEHLTMVNNKRCVHFRPKVSADIYFVIVRNCTGCSATVGYNKGYTGDRYLNLMHTSASSCMYTGTIQHELLHILGFYHEHSRPDRDHYVKIQLSNVPQSLHYAFEKYPNEQIDTLGTAYDYSSIMHYNRYAFSTNSMPTVIPTKNATADIGQRHTLSPIDILEIQRYYGCVSTPPVKGKGFPSNIQLDHYFLH